MTTQASTSAQDPGPSQGHAGEGPALRCTGLVKRFDDLTAVAGIDLEVQRGECFGLLGPNGAGKTTTIEILEGLTPADEGDVELLGRRWGSGQDQELRERLGVQLQETELGERQRVEEVIVLFRSFYKRGRTVDEVLKLLELESKRKSSVKKLSGGQKQRLALACALVSDPELLFLDEPTTGLDPQARRRLWDVVEDYKAAGGTIVLTTHYMEEAAQLCDRLAIIDRGRVIARGTPRELIESLGAQQVVEFDLGPGALAPELEGLEGLGPVSTVGDHFVVHVDEVAESLPRLLDALRVQGRTLRSIAVHRATLDDVFLHLTGRALRED